MNAALLEKIRTILINCLFISNLARYYHHSGSWVVTQQPLLLVLDRQPMWRVNRRHKYKPVYGDGEHVERLF